MDWNDWVSEFLRPLLPTDFAGKHRNHLKGSVAWWKPEKNRLATCHQCQVATSVWFPPLVYVIFTGIVATIFVALQILHLSDNIPELCCSKLIRFWFFSDRFEFLLFKRRTAFFLPDCWRSPESSFKLLGQVVWKHTFCQEYRLTLDQVDRSVLSVKDFFLYIDI